MAEPAHLRGMTLADFEAFEKTLPEGERAELISGVVYMMTGGTLQHATAIGQLFLHLGDRLRNGPCRPFTEAAAVEFDGEKVYPDASVDCSDRDPSALSLKAPSLIFEVLSPSTALKDLGVKGPLYMRIPSVVAAVMFDIDNRLVHVFRPDQVGRNGGVYAVRYGDDAALEFDLPGGAVSLDMAAVFPPRPA